MRTHAENDRSHDDLHVPTLPVPKGLLVSVERLGLDTLASGAPRIARPISCRAWTANLALMSFCLGHLFWCARQIGLIP